MPKSKNSTASKADQSKDLKEVFCEATGKRFRADIGGDISPGTRFFAKGAKDDHKRIEQDRGCRVVHVKAIYGDRVTNIREINKDNAEFRKLVAGVKSVGVTTPIIVKRSVEYLPCSYEIIDGHRRHSACIEAGESLIPVTIAKGDVSSTVVALINNLNHDDMDALDVAITVSDIAEKMKKEKGKAPSQRELEDLTGIGQSKINGYLSVAKGLDSSVTESYRKGDLPFSKLVIAATLPVENQADTLEQAKKLSTKEFRKFVADKRKSLGVEKPGNKPSKTKVRRGDRKLQLRLASDIADALEAQEKELASLRARRMAKEKYSKVELAKVKGAVSALQYAFGVVESVSASPADPNLSSASLRRKSKKASTKAPSEPKKDPTKPAKKRSSKGAGKDGSGGLDLF